jgi:hypothetical protein
VQDYLGDPVAQATNAMNVLKVPHYLYIFMLHLLIVLKFQLRFYFDVIQHLQQSLAQEREAHHQSKQMLEAKERLV